MPPGRDLSGASSIVNPQHAEADHLPLNQAKAALFRTLGHPVRIRVLELLQEGPLAVRDLLEDVHIEASSLSQQLAVLRREGLVTSTRRGSVVEYALSTDEVGTLLGAGRELLGRLQVAPEVRESL